MENLQLSAKELKHFKELMYLAIYKIESDIHSMELIICSNNINERIKGYSKREKNKHQKYLKDLKDRKAQSWELLQKLVK